mmetsp:Transcript_16729/g.50081  ORF Transcript_16729/g.50081 Transcript_16729/m.50081 type:complete len:235 (+) Transcript_16729:4229-4933(+)
MPSLWSMPPLSQMAPSMQKSSVPLPGVDVRRIPRAALLLCARESCGRRDLLEECELSCVPVCARDGCPDRTMLVSSPSGVLLSWSKLFCPATNASARSATSAICSWSVRHRRMPPSGPGFEEDMVNERGIDLSTSSSVGPSKNNAPDECLLERRDRSWALELLGLPAWRSAFSAWVLLCDRASPSAGNDVCMRSSMTLRELKCRLRQSCAVHVQLSALGVSSQTSSVTCKMRKM